MKLVQRLLTRVVAASLALVAVPSWADWAESPYPEIVRPQPDTTATQAQNPPSLVWPRYKGTAGATGYIVELSKGGTVYGTYTTNRTQYWPATRLPAGTYTWRVRPNSVVAWTTPRTFVIGGTSTVFEVPETATLSATVLNKARPRQLETGFKPVSQWTAAMHAERDAALAKLTTDVNAQIATYALPSDSDWPVTSTTPSAARTVYINQISSIIGKNVRQMESAALLFRLTNDDRYLNEVLRRGDSLAALDPNGMTSYVNHDIGTRQIMIAMAKGIDLLGSRLDSTRRTQWEASLKLRVKPMYDELVGENFKLDEKPLDSHGQTNLAYVATIAVLMLGEFPEAKVWFDNAVRQYFNSVLPWSGPEGGYANGGAYGMYAMDYFLALWQPLVRATGVDLYKKPWTIGFSNMVAQFMPPGAPGLVFGDQHEEYLYLFQIKAFMSRIATPTAAWYVRNIAATENPLTLLQASYPLPADTVTPAAPPNAIVMPSTGMVAMHSSIADRARTSVYFKSSPFGSYNHSHGDQNGIVIDSGGRRLLVEAGYQDYFMSPLGVSWYRQTKAHNAITYDGGVGQSTNEGVYNVLRNGKITAFSTSSTVDYAEGNATPAYNSALTNAVRKVWYVRSQDVVVVMDKLGSATPRKFEWNMHTLGPIVQESATKLKMTNVDRSLCMTSLSTDGTAYQSLTAPANPKQVEYHGAFIKPTAATSAEFLVVLDVNCRRPAVSLTNVSGGRSLKIGTTTIVLPN